MGKSSKRKKNFYCNRNLSKKQKTSRHQLEPGKVGFLCTTNDDEKGCVREAYDILNQVANKLFGEEKLDPSLPRSHSPDESKERDEAEEESIEASLETELNSLRNQSKQTPRRFQQVNTRAKNCIFISTLLQDPLQIQLKIMEEILASGEAKTRKLIRMVPVQKTCKAFAKDIEKAAKELLEEIFPKESTTYCIVFKVRHNSSLMKDEVVFPIVNLIDRMGCKHSVSYTQPKLVINVDVVKTICCIGILPDYFTRYCKYNLIEIAKKESKQLTSADTIKEADERIS